ncbi:MAG: ABC transporter permease [Chloroflexota bacterium]
MDGRKMGHMFHGIKETLLDSYRIGVKDLRELLRDRMMLASFIVMPLFMMLITGYIFPSQRTLADVPLGIVNQDTGRLSALIIEPLAQMRTSGGKEMFYLTALSDLDEATDRIKNQQISGALLIPADFSDRIVSGTQGAVTIITDQSNPQISALLTTTLEKIMADISAEAGRGEIAGLLPELPNPETVTRPFVVRTEGIVPGKPNYFQFVVPGVMCMIITFAVLMGIAASITREREDGTIDGIMIAPISRLAIILGKVFSQTVRGLLQAAIVLSLAMLLFGVVIHGSIILVIFLLLLGVFSFIGLGVLVSSLGERQETATTVMVTLQFPMLFLSGVFFPIQQMPGFVQVISRAVPLTYAVQAMRKVIVLGAGIREVLPEIAVMAVFGTVMLIIGVKVFNRAMTR